MIKEHDLLRVAAVAFLLLSSTGCGVIGPGDSCTLIGCNSGLTVHLNAKPTGAYKVEVVSHPFVRITTSTGTKTVEITTVNYVTSRPNGPDCDPECRQATVNVDIP